MAASFILGNLIGRAVVSYALVWLACWLASRLRWREAFARSVRWYGVLAVAALTLLGLAAGVAPAGGAS